MLRHFSSSLLFSAPVAVAALLLIAPPQFFPSFLGGLQAAADMREADCPVRGKEPARDAALPSAQLQVGESTLDVVFSEGRLDLPRAKVLEWISDAANAVATYYGRFPMKQARLRIFPARDERGVFQGITFGSKVASTRISIGEHTLQSDLDEDWMMTHELIHLGFPSVSDEHHWIEEGMATYVEPIARAQAGGLNIKQVWGDMVRGMPKGQPGWNDAGLDRTHTWGRTYWGGALFCLLADVEIRRRTGNRKGLQDALRGILAAGGTIEESWPLTRALQTGDRATGVSVLTELYNQMKDAPVRTDLDHLWQELGVEMKGDEVIFREQAPLAAVRRAITARPSNTNSFPPKKP